MNKSRPKQVMFRLSKSEHELLQIRISESGLTSQEFIRQAVLQGTIQSNSEIRDLVSEVKKVGTELSRQGNNLNQIANALNAQNFVDYMNHLFPALDASRKAREDIGEIWQLLKQYLQKHQ